MLGDFNSRTGILSDSLNVGDVGTNIRNGLSFDGEMLLNSEMNDFSLMDLQRVSEDLMTNNNGHSLIDLCQSSELKIVNGRFGSDKGIGRYTCFNYNGNSVIDYAIVSACLLAQIIYFCVKPLDKCLSDVHCPISLTIRANNLGTHKCETLTDTAYYDPEKDYRHMTHLIFKHRWKPELKATYQETFNLEVIKMYDSMIDAINISNTNLVEINNISKGICDVMVDPAKSLGLCKAYGQDLYKCGRTSKKLQKRKPWFNAECIEAHRKYFKSMNIFKFNRSAQSKVEIKCIARKYKSIIRKCSRQYYDSLHRKLHTLKKSNSNEYWSILNAGKPSGRLGNVSIETFAEYFKKLSQKSSDNCTPEDQQFDLRQVTSPTNEYINDLFTLLL